MNKKQIIAEVNSIFLRRRRRKKIQISAEEFEKIRKEIFRRLRNGEITARQANRRLFKYEVKK